MFRWVGPIGFSIKTQSLRHKNVIPHVRVNTSKIELGCVCVCVCVLGVVVICGIQENVIA